MDDHVIAVNRFGLGGPLTQIRGAPQQWLRGQIKGYDPAPAPIERGDSLSERMALVRSLRSARDKAYRAKGEPDADIAAIETQLAERSKAIRDEAKQRYFADIDARFTLASQSETPFMERLVHFWSNHFTVSTAKDQLEASAGPFEAGPIRANLTGTFRDMLHAATFHPAMQIYLDQILSVGPTSPRASRRADRTGANVGLNENLAREILELHTLGVDGGYSQIDVTEFARALTGWTVDVFAGGRDVANFRDHAVFDPAIHEPGERSIVGRRYAARGARQALNVLDDLAASPTTARFIATKLARHFAGDTPPPAMIARLTDTFLRTDGDLPSLYRAIVDSPEAWVEEPVKFRRPWEWIVATIRTLGMSEMTSDLYARMLNQMGQLTWNAPSPAGFDDVAMSWAGPNALVTRVEIAELLGRRNADRDALELARESFGEALGVHTSDAIRNAETGAQAVALLLASPEMMRR